jgi:hypothetical protein
MHSIIIILYVILKNWDFGAVRRFSYRRNILHQDVLFLGETAVVSSGDGYSNNITKTHIQATVRLVRLFSAEFEWVFLLSILALEYVDCT